MPHTAQTSSSMGFSLPHAGHGQVGACPGHRGWRLRSVQDGRPPWPRWPHRHRGHRRHRVGDRGRGDRDRFRLRLFVQRTEALTAPSASGSPRRRSPGTASASLVEAGGSIGPGYRPRRPNLASEPAARLGRSRRRLAGQASAGGGLLSHRARRARDRPATCGSRGRGLVRPRPSPEHDRGRSTGPPTASATASTLGAVRPAGRSRRRSAPRARRRNRPPPPACAQAAASMNTLPQPSTSMPASRVRQGMANTSPAA